MNNPILDSAPVLDRADLTSRIAELRARVASPSGETAEQFGRLDDDFQAFADHTRCRLLGTGLAWSDEDRREAAWVRHANDELAVLGHSLCMSLGKRYGAEDASSVRTMAITLANMGNVLKWEVAVTRDTPHDLGKPHAILRAAMEAGQHRKALQMRYDGRDVECTLESLYFRALLLARFSSGALNMKQIEILDAWMWMWMPVLKGVEEAPSDSALRVDLDSRDGLRRGRRLDAGPSLYLPSVPIEEAYRAIVREFHAGRIVPAEGITTTFRLEEHVAVMDLIRRGLRDAKRATVSRAERSETLFQVELHVGLAEVLSRGFCPAPPAPAMLTLAARDGERLGDPRLPREHDNAPESIYERRRRIVRVTNVSETGFGIEGDERECGSIAVGDVVALRLEAGAALELCKVMRSVPSAAAGRRLIGVRRLSARSCQIEVVQPSAASERERAQTVLFVPGDDESGQHDACLVPERTYAERAPLEASVGDCVYTFRFNRPRDSGRGWVLAGFEILAATGESNYAVG